MRRILKRLGIRRRFNALFLAVFSLLVVALMIYAALVADTFTRIESSIGNIERVLGTLQNSAGATISVEDYERLQSAIKDVSDTLTLSQRRLILVRPFADVHPVISTTLKNLDIAKLLTDAAQDMLNGLQPSVFYLVSGDQGGVTQLSSGDRLVELLEIASGQFAKAESELDEAAALIEQLDLNTTSLDLLRTSERIISFHRQIASINGILMNSSALLNVVLGLDGEKTYLVLGANSDEIRPSGGFVSTWGWFKVRNGRIVEFDYAASEVDNPIPPDRSQAETLSIPNWWIDFRQPIYAAWDGSWYADFPSTAEMAMWYYNNGNNVNAPVDGVLSIDIYGFEYLVDVLGDIPLPQYDLVVNRGNFRDLVYDIRITAPGETPHKQFVADIYDEIMTHWQEATRDPEQNTRIINALLRAVQEKHIMVHLADDQFDDAIDLLGWSGHQNSREGSDYLMVVNSNLSNKATRSVSRSVTYDVSLEDDGLLNKRLTLSYVYSAEVASQDPGAAAVPGREEYLAMVQFYAPSGSLLVEYPDNVTFPSEGSFDDLWLTSTIFRLPYNDSRRVQFLYTSPNGYTRFGNYGRYRLTIQKQAGTDADEMTIQVMLPPDSSMVESNPAPSAEFSLERNLIEYQLRLTTDQQIDLIFKYDDDAVPPPTP